MAREAKKEEERRKQSEHFKFPLCTRCTSSTRISSQSEPTNPTHPPTLITLCAPAACPNELWQQYLPTFAQSYSPTSSFVAIDANPPADAHP